MNFFSEHPNNLTVSDFDMLHISVILFFAIAIILTIIFKNKIRESKHEKVFRYTVTFLAIAFELAYKIWYGVTSQGRLIEDYLGLDLCAISLYLVWVLMFTNKKWVFKLVYFFSIGAIVSLLVPNMHGFGPDHFRFYHYFYVHGFIVWAPIYYIAVHGYTIRFKDYLIAIGVILPLSLIVMGVDFLINANYMFLHHKPDVATPLDLLGPWPIYIYWLVLVVISLFMLWYIPWFFINKKKKRDETNEDVEIQSAA